ncbi:type II toxin-antitoxin system VapC family toxin [Benzoatithermus flavus]|uniref:Type II toxin-antitoxin system VapC family toxin n=1 Tax=Benzoatithermus flavus TaxID=3108223 RepID=A0ABU8XQM8_9PROT
MSRCRDPSRCQYPDVIGAEHPHEKPSADLLERIGAGAVEAIIDAEMLQELLHRYRTIGRWETASKVYGLTRRLFPMVLPVTAEIMDEAHDLMDCYHNLMARDGVRAAVVRLHDLDAICSYDRAFDVIAGLQRVEPDAILA